MHAIRAEQIYIMQNIIEKIQKQKEKLGARDTSLDKMIYNSGTANGLRHAALHIDEAAKLKDKWEVRIVEGREFISREYLGALLWQESVKLDVPCHFTHISRHSDFLGAYHRGKAAAKHQRRQRLNANNRARENALSPQ